MAHPARAAHGAESRRSRRPPRCARQALARLSAPQQPRRHRPAARFQTAVCQRRRRYSLQRRQPSSKGHDTPWIFTSGLRGLTKLDIPVQAKGQPATYTVKLMFAALEGDKPGQRVFDVKLGDKVVLKAFDPATRKGAIVEEFKTSPRRRISSVELIPSYNKGFDNGRCHKPDSEFRDNDRSNHSYESSEMHSNSAHTEHHSSDNLQWLSVSAALVLLIFALDCGRHLGEQEFNPLSSRNITYTEAPMYLERSEASTQKSKRDFAADQRQQELERKWLESMSVNDRTSQLAKQSSSPSAQSSETAKPEFTWNSQPSTSGGLLV
jgi:hypothetical protein